MYDTCYCDFDDDDCWVLVYESLYGCTWECFFCGRQEFSE